ncbi:MAG: methylmalonyl-CoA mutase family protein, partial [Nocardioides sp.]
MTHRADWERAVAGVLRKTGRLATEAADHEAIATITRHTIDGIEVHPLPEPTPPPSAATRGRARGNWDIRVLADPDAVGLEEGATSVWFPRADQHRLQAQLEALALDRTPVILDGHPDSAPASVTTFRRALGNRQAAPTTNLGYDAAASDAAANPQALADLLEAARELGVLAAVADATTIHDRGASDVLELAYALACGTAWLRAAAAHGLSAEEAAALLEFRFAATADQFATIAKLRAARSCWASLCPDAPIMRQHAVTSRPMMTRYDAHTNLLRTTVAAFSAAVGGADSITVLPYDAALGEPDADARRLARNISALLHAESHLGVVDDPAGGAPAVEALTNSLAAAALAQLEEIEAAGGIGSAGADAWCEQALTAIRERRDRAIATRRQPITGVSEFPLADESPIHRDGTPL